MTMEELDNNFKPDLSLGNLHFTQEDKDSMINKYIAKGKTREWAEAQVDREEKKAQNQRAKAILKSEIKGN